MKLSKRLQAIYDMVNSPCILADIGCDHALLPIALTEKGKCEKAYACDVHKGPLERGAKAIQEAHLTDKISTVLGNGLQEVPNDITCVIIAGMGWETIVSILSNDIVKAQQCQQLILQSNNHVDDLRRWLSEHNFVIEKEDLVFEQHFYQILSVHPGAHKLTEDEIFFGMEMQQHALFVDYWTHILHKKEKILQRLQPYHDGYEQLQKDVNRIREKLNIV